MSKKPINLKSQPIQKHVEEQLDFVTDSELESQLTATLDSSKTYTDTQITNLIDSAPDAMNTLNELADAINSHQDIYEAYVEQVSTSLAGKADKEHGTHLTLGTGSENAFRGDYGNTAYTHSQAAHAPSNAQKNSDITKAEIEAKLTGAITSHTHSYAPVSHGNHVPTTQTANNAIFLRNDNTWQTITPANIGAAPAEHGTHLTIGTGASNAAAGNHTHNYAGSSSAGGAANSVKTNLVVKLNGGTTEGTNLFTFNGSTAKTINITPSSIGAAASSHGTHLTLGTGSSNAFRGDYGNTAYTHSQAAHAPSNAQKNSDITKAEIEAKLTGSITSHTHTVLSVKSDNWKDSAALPSTYDRGETIFFSNNPSSNKFNDLTYGMVQTFKEYGSGPAAWQFLYPYNATNDKFYVRNAQYNTDSWGSWAEVYTSLNKPTPADIGAAAASHGTHLTIGTGASNAAAGNHTHNYAGSSSAGGAANSVKTNLVVKLNGGTTEGTNLFTFNGSTAKTINITPSSIGAAASSHGTHVSYGGNGSATTVSRSDHTHTLFTRSAVGDIGWSTSANQGLPVAVSAIAYWDGAYSGTASNLTYCKHGAFGTAATKNIADFAAASHGTHLTIGTGASNAAAGNHTHNAIVSRGNVTCETGANVRPAVAGLSMAQVYSNGYPTTYGNIISLRGAGDGQILVGWSGTSGAHAPMYVRSRRDTTDADWSDWAQIYTSANPQSTINGLSFWTGTQAQYDALSSKSSTTVYIIK